MRGLISEVAMKDGLLPSFEEMEFLQEDDLYTEVFGHHNTSPHGSKAVFEQDDWDTGILANR